MNITMSSTMNMPASRFKCPDCDGSGRCGWLYEEPLTLAERVAILEKMMEK